jgi:hypothetical protein
MPRRDPEQRRAYQRAYQARRLAEDPSYYESQRKLQRAARRRRKDACIALVKQLKGEPCADCGQRFDPVCMDFDHRPGEQKRTEVSRIAAEWPSMAVLLAEIAKCDLVCANCHRLRTKHRMEAK